MDLDYMHKFQFSASGGGGGLPFFVDAPLISSTFTLTGGSLVGMNLAIPGGLVYKPCMNQIDTIATEKDPWAIEVREDFDSLLDLISVSSMLPVKQNRTKRSNTKSKNLSR